ncbi:HAMP domain-containing histidine kinase [Marinitoga sp. 38H-ov]|uniref:HAMP domain-containing histidine kinase n=1 Tax=Marinitoga sp. 38H-ov TaxID=1755814 RepID=UPI0013EBC68A|nr:HAMP domain-containing histidine kinase [Marinitoga sp. 38H-ov]KAF2955209.1 hypothetical protein AS160_01535 [Marinitoga sp. 38H-ov]
MSFISNLNFEEFNDYINLIFNKTLETLKADSGSLIIFDDDKNIIFKIMKNLEIDINNIKPGKIDEMFINSKNPIIINNEDLEKKGILPKKKDTISSIVFPMYFKNKLIGVMNLNRKSVKFTLDDLKKLNDNKIFLMPSIYNIILLEEVHDERERFKKYLNVFELIVEKYSTANTVIDFINETINEIRRKYKIKINIETVDEPDENTIKIKNLYYKFDVEYSKDEDIVNKLKSFMMKMTVIKHVEELNKVLSEYSDLAKETLLMNFMSWDLIQEINSAITGINLITFFFESTNPEISNELKKSINRIKEAVERYKSNFYNNESIELIDISNVVKEVENKIKFLNPDISFTTRIKYNATIYGSRKILFNSLMNIVVSVLKYTSNRKFNVELYHEESYYYLKIETKINSSEINNRELKKAINISSTMLSNYHIDFLQKTNKENTDFILQIPAK